MKNTISLLFVFCFSALFLSVPAQTLTVRDIMREPSLAGMRPDSQRLAPNGKFIIYAWNAEGKEPRNLYIADSDAKEPRILVNADQNYEARTPPPESKLNYGLIVRDDFVKAREKNLGGVDISPDSKRILFSQNSDIYVLDFETAAGQTETQKAQIKSKWANYELSMIRIADLMPNLVRALQLMNIKEPDVTGRLADARSRFLNAVSAAPQGENGDKNLEQKQSVIDTYGDFGQTIGRLLVLQENYPQLRANETFMRMQDELTGVENRINVARLDYGETVRNVNPKPRRITRTQGFEGGARWLTNDSILYSSSGNYFVLNLKETSLIQVTKEANPASFISIFGVNPTKDGKMIAYILSDGSRQKSLFVPNYLDEFVQANSTRRGFTDQKVFVAPTDGSREKPFEINLPKAEGVGYIRGVRWAADNSSLVVDRLDKDLKRRQLFYIHDVGSKAEQTILVTEDTDEKWIAPLSSIVETNPKNDAQIIFGSEKDGFNHLYLATLERAKPQSNPAGEQRQENPTDSGFTKNVAVKQLTNGAFQVEWAKWSADGKQIIFNSTEENTAEREFYALDSATFRKTKVFAGSEKGMRSSPQISETGERPVLLYEFSRWNQPTELYSVEVCTGCRGLSADNRLTNSTPESFRSMKWNEPRFVDIPSRDGKQIKSKIYTPADFDKTKKYPMVIFVHGAGYLQNTINGWNNYYREFMFNEMLTNKGYVVLDIDYRGSAGYGRDWRTDVYDFLGGKDYDDHLDAIDYAVKNYAVDAKKIGVYGGSYGGFMAEMLVFRTDKITCAAALRPVADWKNYYYSSPVYTAERLGFPDKNPDGYKRSSPIAYAETLNKPLLILHGLVDDNVPAQDSMQLVEKLIRLEKTNYFDEMIYPSESHGFTRPTSWTDEYTRILNFFEKHLK